MALSEGKPLLREGESPLQRKQSRFSIFLISVGLFSAIFLAVFLVVLSSESKIYRANLRFSTESFVPNRRTTTGEVEAVNVSEESGGASPQLSAQQAELKQGQLLFRNAIPTEEEKEEVEELEQSISQIMEGDKARAGVVVEPEPVEVGEPGCGTLVLLVSGNHGPYPTPPAAELYASSFASASSATNNVDGWYSFVAEPHREVTLDVENAITGSTGVVYKWEIKPGNTDADPGDLFQISSQDQIGDTLTVKFLKPAESFEVFVVEVDEATGEGLRVGKASVLCRYVRREVRTLTREDREAFLDALETIYRVPKSEGVEKYGEGYVGYRELVLKHQADRDEESCSPFHGSASFLPSHASFTREIERAIQLVNPTVAFPYWDMFADGDRYGEDWLMETELFQEDWFGGSGNPDKGHALDSGRFANIKLIKNPSNHGANAYGYVSEPHNNDPSMYLTRSFSVCGLRSQTSLSGCSVLQECLRLPSLNALSECVEQRVHNPVHFLVGGAFDCGRDLSELQEKFPPKILQFLGLYTSMFWAMMEHRDYITCPTECDEDTPFEECRCSCPALDSLLQGGQSLSFDSPEGGASQLLAHSHAYVAMMADAHWDEYLFSELGDKDKARNQKYYFKYLTPEENEDLMTWLVQYICSPGKVGSMAAAPTSPYDPFFFIVHPVYERIWAGMRLQKDTVYKDFDWSFQDDDKCYGHHLEDKMPWDNLYDEDRDLGDLLTNADILKAIDPSNPNLPYMYDSFDFPTCG